MYIKYDRMFDWHRKILNQIMENLNLDTYQVAWISFLEGIVLTIIFYEFFIR